MNLINQYEKYLVVVRKFVPQFNVVAKSDSALHKLIAKLLFFNKGYMEYFWTTIGYTTAYPTSAREDDGSVLLHEGQHAIQAKNSSRIVFSFLYLVPQIFVFLAILAPFFNMLFLLFLFCALPWPAPWRKKYELEAYKNTIVVMQWTRGNVTEYSINYIAEQNFRGMNYYIMWPWIKKIKEELRQAANDARALHDRIRSNDYLMSILNMLHSEGLLHSDGIIDIKQVTETI